MRKSIIYNIVSGKESTAPTSSVSASYAETASYVATASFAHLAVNSIVAITADQAFSASYSVTSDNAVSASHADNATFAETAITAFGANVATSASYSDVATLALTANTASYINLSNYNGNVNITGSLIVSASTNLNGGAVAPLVLAGNMIATSASAATATFGNNVTLDVNGINSTQPIKYNNQDVLFSKIINLGSATNSLLPANDAIYFINNSGGNTNIYLELPTDNNSQFAFVNESNNTAFIFPTGSATLISKHGNKLVGSGSVASVIARTNASKLYLFGDLE
jgi:hypothetical protein